MILITPSELAQIKTAYLAWGDFQKNDPDCAQDYRYPETDLHFRLISTLEHYFNMGEQAVGLPGDRLIAALDAVQAEMATLNANLPVMTAQLTALNVNLAGLQSADLQTILHDLALFMNWLKPKKEGLKMAMKNATGKSNEELQTAFMKEAADNKFAVNWPLLLAWAEKWVPTLFWPVVMDVISGNWAALWALAASQGPQCVIELLAALGITLSPATP